MNILMLTRLMGQGGTEKIIIQICEMLKDKKVKVYVCSGGGVLEPKLKKMGIEHIKVSDLETKNPIIMFQSFKVIKNLIKEKNISVIHTHHRMAAFYVMLLKMVVKVKHLHTAHNIFEDKKIFSWLVLRKAYVIAVGKEVKNSLISNFNLKAENIKVIYNSVQKKDLTLSKEDPLICTSLEKGYKIVGNFGRLTEQKGFEYYIEAASIILSKGYKVHFLIVGEGEFKNLLIKRVEELGIDENVQFLGYRSDIQELMSIVDFTVLSSLWEGFPLIPIESFSVGKTVVGTSINGTIEIIENRKNGLLVPPRDAIELSKSIQELLDSQDLLDMLNENAYKTYDNLFSMNKFESEYWNSYIAL